MKLGETDPTARRIGPFQADVLDTVQIKVNGGSFGAAGGTLVAIGGTPGFVYYQATAIDASVRGFVEVRTIGLTESTIREEVEPNPQGIPARTSDASLLIAGSIRLVDGGGVELTDLVGVDVEVTINGSDWAAPVGELVLTDDGYADYQIDPSEATARGWLAVKVSGACQEGVFRVDIVAGERGPTAPLTKSTVTTVDVLRIAGDLALAWYPTDGAADLSKVLDAAGSVVDIASDRGIVTAALLSIGLDRRAEEDDVPPSGDPTDRRGWWGDEFLEVEGDKVGSRLWLLDRAKLTSETARRAEEYVRESLAWMVEDKVVASIGFEIEERKDSILYAVSLERPGRKALGFRFSHTWDHLEVL